MKNSFKQVLTRLIFLSRWLQLPLYLGLILVLGLYAYRFILELFHLFTDINRINDSQIMLGVLNLIDVVMIANLLIMVLMGGYETFVSRLDLEGNPDQPEWLDHLDSGAMKIKLALALVGISSIHLLSTFIDSTKMTNFDIMWQVLIHLTLLFSVLAIAWVNQLIRKEH